MDTKTALQICATNAAFNPHKRPETMEAVRFIKKIADERLLQMSNIELAEYIFCELKENHKIIQSSEIFNTLVDSIDKIRASAAAFPEIESCA